MNRHLTTTISFAALLALLSCQGEPAAKEEEKKEEPSVVLKTIGEIERLDPVIDNLVPANVQIEVLAEGFDWSEGPVWVADGDYVLFSDIPPNRIYKWKAGEGKSVYLEGAGYTGNTSRGGEKGTNGLLLNAGGKLVMCQHGDRAVSMMDAPLSAPVAEFTILAESYDGMRFNSPNDAAFRSNGDLYFTDPPYGLEQGMEDPAKEIDFQGVYRLDTEGNVHLLTDQMTRPNGIAFSPDEKTLYVANSDPDLAIWMAFDVADDGSVSNDRVFFDATSMVGGNNKGLPDGLKVNPDGFVFATGPGGVLIFSPDRKHLGTIRTGEATANCAFGNDGEYLYMTADMYLCRVKLK